MDESIRQRNKEILDTLMQNVLDSDCPIATKDLFVSVAQSMQVLNESIESAHTRLDHRKDEYNEILEEFQKLYIEVAKLTETQSENNKACIALIKTVDRQVKEVRKAYKRQHLYTALVIVTVMLSSMGVFKTVTTTSSIWNIVQTLIP